MSPLLTPAIPLSQPMRSFRPPVRPPPPSPFPIIPPGRPPAVFSSINSFVSRSFMKDAWKKEKQGARKLTWSAGGERASFHPSSIILSSIHPSIHHPSFFHPSIIHHFFIRPSLRPSILCSSLVHHFPTRTAQFFHPPFPAKTCSVVHPLFATILPLISRQPFTQDS